MLTLQVLQAYFSIFVGFIEEEIQRGTLKVLRNVMNKAIDGKFGPMVFCFVSV